MHKPRVLVVVITKDYVEQECLNAIISQDYENYSWMISGMKPGFDDMPWTHKLYMNCSHNRECARKMALASDAEYFLFLDSDVVIPDGTISEFVLQMVNSRIPGPRIRSAPGIPVPYHDNTKHIIGGWYKMVNSNRWICGSWVADNTFVNCMAPGTSLTKVDVIGMGCMFISREALSVIPFEHGTDIEYTDGITGQRMMLGECGKFGNNAFDKGYELFMDGSVICKHLTRQGSKTETELRPVVEQFQSNGRYTKHTASIPQLNWQNLKGMVF
jgi:hypothetical protein